MTLCCGIGRSALKEARTNLILAIKSLITVLKEVDHYPALYLNQLVIRESIRRYEHVWIPLLANTRPSERVALVPPLDVEWVWFCHMLCPAKYVVDSAALWAAVRPAESKYLIDHKLHGEKARSDGQEKAKQIWQTAFPNEPFDIMDHIAGAPIQQDFENDHDEVDTMTTSNISYDIAAAASRQMAFHYQVAIMPQYNDDKFLRVAVDRYRNRFLALQEMFPNEIWVPTYDIDVSWHAHMMHPRWYKRETEALRGSILPHDDTLNDRSPDSKLLNRWDATKAKWLQVFAEPVSRNGGMWRGNVEAAERVLRSRILGTINDIERRLRRPNGTLFSLWDEERVRDENLEGDDWVHRTDWRRSNHMHYGASNVENTVERFTFLARSGERDPILMCRTTHFLMYGPEGDPQTFCTAVELYPNARGESGKSPRYPIATAHHALPQSVCVRNIMEKKVCTRIPREAVLVLRVGGEDFGLLCGRWVEFRAPKKGVPGFRPGMVGQTNGTYGMLGDKGNPGVLRLRLWLFGEYSPGRWILPSRSGSRLEPGSFSFKILRGRSPDLARREETISVDLSGATVRVDNKKLLIPGYLICMASAALHVALQPRFEPRGGASVEGTETMYPAWCVRQKDHATLRGAGGEVVVKGRIAGLSVLRFPMVLGRDDKERFFLGKVDDIGNPNVAAAGCGGCGGGCASCG